MRQPVERMSSKSSVDILALDWEALGRFVRARTLEAVAGHIAAMGGVLSREAGKHVNIRCTYPGCAGESTRTSAQDEASRLVGKMNQSER